jgi:protein tyrosine phosphatase type 4A
MKPNTIASRPSLIEHGPYKFVIMDAPTDANITSYIDQLKKNDVSVVVRACEPTYSVAPLNDAGIRVEEMPFNDGDPPPDDVVNRWMELVEYEFVKGTEKPRTAIAVHCVAGLGRAPALVAIALIESGMDSYDAIELIRKKRRGAINNRQLKYLESYKRKHKDCGVCMIL